MSDSELHDMLTGEESAKDEFEQVCFDFVRAASADPSNVPDELRQRLKQQLSPPQIIELACVVGFWKFYNTIHDSLDISRFYLSSGIFDQGVGLKNIAPDLAAPGDLLLLASERGDFGFMKPPGQKTCSENIYIYIYIYRVQPLPGTTIRIRHRGYIRCLRNPPSCDPRHYLEFFA